MSSVQSTIRPGSRRAFLPHFQEIQYLSRSQSASPPLSAVALNASGPVVTIVDAVTQQWQGLNNDQPLVANPTFVAAPNAVYDGEVQLPSGQVLHRSTALNAFHVIRNGETGLPVTMSCHKFTFHLAAPSDPQQVWELEVPYPTNERLQQAMTTMSLDAHEELSYPTCATKEAPPMMPLEQRIRLNKVDSSDIENEAYLPSPQLSHDGAAPAEDVVAQTLTSVSPLVLRLAIDTGIMRVAEDIGELERPKTPTLGTEGRRAAQLELAHEIYLRAKESLRLDGDDLFDSDSDAESMPALESPHQPETCPMIETALQQAARNDGTARGSKEPTDLHRVLDAVLGPFLTREAQEVFEAEFDSDHIKKEAERTVTMLEQVAVEALQEMARSRSSDEESSLGSRDDQNITITRQEGRADSPYPRSRRNHWPADPRFTLNPNSGIVVMRDEWSSSASPHSSSDSGSYDDNSCFHVIPEIEPLTPGNWSPPASWIATRTQTLQKKEIFPNTPDLDGIDSAPRYEFRDQQVAQLLGQLRQWVHIGTAQQETQHQWEEGLAAEPGNLALQTLHGRLRRFLDYTAMAAEGVLCLQPSPPPYPFKASFQRTQGRWSSGLTETTAIRLFAGVRHAILETGILAEEMVWPRFGITKHHGREELAHILHKLLSIRLRDDYVISKMLSAGFLDYNYPEDVSDYHELL
ncbi:hypothetical protein K438DRAFT_2059862 [Mycena galopus ATCC 62051]|nr:hypothetical protein K438DRAFT_2059862 [Mycena galopus ATCC 62051]